MHFCRYILLLAGSAVIGLTACYNPNDNHNHADPHDHRHAHENYHRLTHWTDNLEVFARFELHETSARIEGDLYISKAGQPAENVRGEIRLLENGSAVTSHRLENGQDGTFRFELSFQESNEPSLAVFLQTDGEDQDIILGRVNHEEENTGRPDANDLVELGKTMQWRMSIRADIAVYRNIPEVVSGFGKVLPDPLYFREISSPVDGHIDPRDLSVLPASGTYIRAGERITAISPPLATDNSWIEQRLAFQQADEAYERAKRLIENDAISLREYHQREREYEVRRAGYEHFIENTHYGAHIEDAGQHLYLNAIQDGVIAESYVVTGKEVNRGDPLFTMYDPDHMWVEILAYHDELSGLSDITGAELLTGRNDSMILKEGNWDLVTRDLRIDNSGSRSKVTLSVNNSEGLLSPFQPVRVRLIGNEGQRVLAVPNEAIFDNDSHKVIFIMHSGDQFERRIIQSGVSYGGWTAITNGLEEGERVVTNGIYPLHLMTGNVQIDEDHDH